MLEVVVNGGNIFGDLKLNGESVDGEEGELDVGDSTGWPLTVMKSADREGLRIRRLPRAYILP